MKAGKSCRIPLTSQQLVRFSEFTHDTQTYLTANPTNQAYTDASMPENRTRADQHIKYKRLSVMLIHHRSIHLSAVCIVLSVCHTHIHIVKRMIWFMCQIADRLQYITAS